MRHSLKKGDEMAEATITGMNFNKQFGGYKKSQVDDYIRKLSDEYRTAYEEYGAMRAERDELIEKLAKQEAGNLNRPDGESFVNTLVNTEIQARQIIREAKERAKKIIDGTIEETSRAKQAARALVEKAEAEAAAAKKKDRMANVENLQIKNCAINNADIANENIAYAINEVFSAGVPA